MLEADLRRIADAVAPPAPSDLPDAVLARLDEPRPPHRWRGAAVAAVAALLVMLGGLSPQVRAFAADLFRLAGIELSRDEPQAPTTPRAPLPGAEPSDLALAARKAAFPLSVPIRLGDPEIVRVADRGRVVSMQWRDGTLVLDQFKGTLGPVFAKRIGGIAVAEVDLGRTTGWWIRGPHDLVYLDPEGNEVTATARLAGPTLIWERADGVTYRLEGLDLGRVEATAIARSLAGTS